MIEVNKQEPLIRQARRRLAELFPDDYSVYEKWEQYKEIYASAYRSAPNNMDKIIEYWIDFLDLDQESAISLSDIVTATTYYSSTSRNRFTYVLIDGGRHSWPDSSSVGFDVRTFILDYCESSFS